MLCPSVERVDLLLALVTNFLLGVFCQENDTALVEGNESPNATTTTERSLFTNPEYIRQRKLRTKYGHEVLNVDPNYFVWQWRSTHEDLVNRSRDPLEYNPKIGINIALTLCGVFATILILTVPMRIKNWLHKRRGNQGSVFLFGQGV
ncbi:hypothetical protein Ciccas_013308 [Cichlidogyrus casuarinus]|uniref:Uncharacterized protein n=1 Tax=Cichlidogyrus casuarinus TaxID=1844966 RepID=A0ABD2PKY1_9PLAT